MHKSTIEDPGYVTVTTQYGDIRGKNYNISESHDLNIFLGIPYAQPPVGDLRLAPPEPVKPWRPDVHHATKHGAKCVQRTIRGDPVLEGVPFSEDCLFLDIYATREKKSPNEKQSVMLYVHPGGFYGGSGAKYNFTNLALKGVVVVSVSYRLDLFGFLSTQDDVIPGNFGLLDVALALDFVKLVISNFGGNPEEITLFGASAGAAVVSIFTLSPLTKGKFHKAIMQSGAALCPWAVFTPGRTVFAPADIALDLGRRLNCSLPATGSRANTSRDLLTCLRATPVDILVGESVAMQEGPYRSNIIFVPVSGDTLGVLPETPEQLLAKTAELVAIPTIVGYTTDDGTWLVADSENDGVTYTEFTHYVNAYITQFFPPSQRAEILQRVRAAYLPSNPADLAPAQLRAILSKITTDLTMAAFIVKQARLFSRAGDHVTNGAKPGTFVYQFDYRPSYSTAPLWHGVGHTDEKGFVLGLPPGPDPFSYPNTTLEDRYVAEIVTTMWADFAKFGDPTPQPFNWPEGLRWPRFGHAPHNQDLLLIDVEPMVKQFDRNQPVVAWTGSSGISTPVLSDFSPDS
ncbi:carboxylic ester hydrolase [Elysia marginata]|uniref:Carboxylic ester hydrolase n=1 Tax=Elysia marginata TaxID=1093978 RepID=A0AAV4GV23_9GAST|nr:carboxylic ester hydrolase [Elysia marginata]